MYHRSAKDIAFTDKVCYEGICRFVVDVSRGAYLLYFSLAHHHDGVAQGQRLLLVVGHIDEGDAQPFVHLLQLQLHVLSHLQVECSQWFVKQQNFRFVDNGSCDGDTLLLSTRKRVDVTVFIVAHVHHLEGAFHLGHDFLLRRILQFQSEGDVVIYIQVREQGIFLKYRVHIALVRWQVGDVITANGNDTLCGSFKACQESQ